MKSLLCLSWLVVVLGCSHKSDPTPLPDYANTLTFKCQGGASEYYARAVIKGDTLCYSTNTPLYDNFAYTLGIVITNTSSASSIQAGQSGKAYQFGVGGLGSSKVPPAPVFFTIETPVLPVNTDRLTYISQTFREGRTLDISVDNTKPAPGYADSKFKIQLFAQYYSPREKNTWVESFYTWNGNQDLKTAYLTVKKADYYEDHCDITLNFRGKFYDMESIFFAEITNGEIRFRYNY